MHKPLLKMTSTKANALIILVCFGLLPGCTTSDPISGRSSPSALQIDFQSGFDHNQVALTINGVEVMDRVLTSEPALGLAKSLQTPPNVLFALEVKVTRPRQCLRRTVNPSNGRYLGIRLDYGTTLTLSQKQMPFLYD